jgi:hypothetical protein
MAILWSRAKEILSRYVGTGGACATNPEVDQFVREVLEYLLISGEYGNEHKFCFCAQQGCITLPYELETPLKVKIDNRIGTVWDRWFEFHQTKYLEDCQPAGTALIEDPNYYPTIYNIPSAGARFGVIGTCQEDEGAHVVVKGIDATGREIFTVHNGEQVSGEYVSIRKGYLTVTNAMFARIDAVVKSKTKGYVQAYWVNPAEGTKGFLADYSPLEEVPQYRRFQLTESCWRTCNAKVSILGRVRLKEAYADNDLIPFDNILALNLAGQYVNAHYNNAPDLAAAKGKALESVIDKENSHKKIKNGNPIEVFLPTSGGSISNIIGGGLRRGFWW